VTLRPNGWDSLLAEVARLGRVMAAAGLVAATGGNLSARLGEGEMAVTAAGAALADLEPGGFVRVDLAAGDHATAPDGPRPSSEWRVHAAAYRARPDASVVFHLHPPLATLLHALGREIRLITLDHAYYLRQVAEVPYLPPGTDELALATAQALGGADVVLLKHHGCVVVASDPGRAFQRSMNLEEAALATYRALLLGDIATACPPEFLSSLPST
jgi:L-fuculose-phosphate aldolase